MRRAVLIAALLVAPLVAAFVYVINSASEEPVPWGLEGVSNDGKTLTVRWVHGDPYCYELGGVEKSESASRVTIEVIREECEGGHTDVYEEATSEVRLDEPLGARILIDGCTGERPPPARGLQERFTQLVRARLDPDDPFAKPVGDLCPAPSRNESGE